MSSTLAESLKQKLAGELSEGERRVGANFRDSLRATLNGGRSFHEEMVKLWTELDVLRRFGFEVDDAIASGKYNPFRVEELELHGSALPPTIAEKDFLLDADGLIDWVVRNGVSFSTVLAILGHDIAEIARHQFSLDETLADFVSPKVTGWAKRNTEPVGEPEDQD
ncbi:MAG TPA: hypothetical protein VFC78_08285 [Tepidisphaeraceae bacterium]|nr:hypothetical protein [Tepidisphaeraceae bacterium]